MNTNKQPSLILSEDAIASSLIQTLYEIQEISDRETPEINGATCPIGDLGGFDSLSFVEMVGMLSGYLGFEIDPIHILDTQNGRSLSVAEIASRITKIVST